MASLQTTHRGCLAKNDSSREDELAAGLDVAPLVARIMVAHGIKSVDEGKLCLTPSLERDWADPLLIPGMAQVASWRVWALPSSSCRCWGSVWATPTCGGLSPRWRRWER